MKVFCLILAMFTGLAFGTIRPLDLTVAQTRYGVQGKSCLALGRDDVVVQPNEVLEGRLPDLNQLNLTEGCKEKARQQVAQWKQEDLDNWEKLSNQLCSAKLDWVEYNPGTCQAGGPPPICTANPNHWYRDSSKAMSSFDNQKKEVAKQRYESLMGEACDCLRSELEDQAARSITSQDTSNPYTVNTDPFVVPCYGDNSCPPGTSCKSGKCRALTHTEHTIESVSEFALETAKDKVIDKWLDMVKEMAEISIPATISSMYGKVISPYLGVLSTTTLSTNRDGYESTLRNVSSDLGRLRRFYQELHDYYQNKPARAPQQISADIRLEKARLRKRMSDLNNFYYFVAKQKELDQYSCYNVFEYQNQMINQSIVNILSLPEPSN